MQHMCDVVAVLARVIHFGQRFHFPEHFPHGVLFNQLARLVGRDVKNVSDDLKHLAELGLVTMDKQATAGEQANAPRAPRVSYDKIRLEISI